MTDGQIITNSEFTFPFAGKDYRIKRATLRQVMDFQRKVSEITKQEDAAGDLRIVAYAIYLALNAVDKNVTEDFVLDNADGDMDVIDVLKTLGFMSQQKVAMMGKIRNSLVNKDQSSGESSSAQ